MICYKVWIKGLGKCSSTNNTYMDVLRILLFQVFDLPLEISHLIKLLLVSLNDTLILADLLTGLPEDVYLILQCPAGQCLDLDDKKKHNLNHALHLIA